MKRILLVIITLCALLLLSCNEDYKLFPDKYNRILSLKNTLNWTLINLVAQLLFAMLLALALNKSMRGRSFFRTMTLVPWAVPHSIAAMTFTFLFNANVGTEEV